MKQRNGLAILALALIVTLAGALDLSAQYRRRDIYDPFYSAGDRLRLRQLIIQWIENDPYDPVQQHLNVIGPLPVGIHCKTATFLTWHRQYIAVLEAWLMGQQDGPKFVPLPKWDPTTLVPDEFFNTDVAPGSAVAAGYPELDSKDANDPNFPLNFTTFLNSGTLCSFVAGDRLRWCMGPNEFFTSSGSALDNFGGALEEAHNPVHGNIGGVMAQGESPAAALFWLWHAWVDDVYQQYLCKCPTTVTRKDLYVMDNNADIGDEPNTTTNIYYLSPEIWVRKNADPVVNGRYSLEDNPDRHENAEYKLVGNNYVYVRVRNRGCVPTASNEIRLRVYWSKAQTAGWVWPDDWTNTPPVVPKRGDEITIPGTPLWVPPLQPGETWTAEIPWQTPNPGLYPNDSYHFCLLARLVGPVDPMAVVEGTDVGTNTRNNNNIAWKNVTVKDDDPFNIINPNTRPWETVHVRNTSTLVHLVRLKFDFPPCHGVYATVDLRNDLYTRWVAGGQHGYGITPVGGTQVRIDSVGAYIDAIPLIHGDIYTLAVRPYVEYGHGYGCKILNYGDRVNFNVLQYESFDHGVTYKLAGGNNYEIRLKQASQTSCGPIILSPIIQGASCPNASDGVINLNILGPGNEYFWSTGGTTAIITGLAPGPYWAVVRTALGCVERRDFMVPDLSNLATTMTTTIPRCNYANGSATVTVTGGAKPYSYKWYLNGSPVSGGTMKTLTGMGFGSYMVAVTDANNCGITAHVNYSDDFMGLGLGFTVTHASSPVAADGAIDMAVLDGMAPYTYQWSNSATTQDLTGLMPGDYSVVVMDNMGCVASGTVTVGVAPSKSLQSVAVPNADLSILAVVPNPATDLAEVQYTLRYATNVKVDVYDEVGKLVTSYDQGMKTPGTNSAWVTTSGLPVGRYTCRLTYRGGVSTIPFVVMR